MVKIKKNSLWILMNGFLIGKLEKEANGSLVFSYDPSWINTPGARPLSLSLPLVIEPFTGDAVYNYFDNLLPDNTQIRARIQVIFKANTNQPFDLLACIGRDCVGAIQITSDDSPEFVKKISYASVNNQRIAKILRDYQNSPLGMSRDVEDFRISIAGAQEKAAFLYYKGKWNIPLAQTPTTHIFKLPIGLIPHQQLNLRDSCENEWLCSLIAQEFGMPVAKSEILHFENVKVLVVERFDRQLSADETWMMRLPQEDMCQALGVSPNLKYQSDGGPGIKAIMKLLLGSVDPVHDRDLFFRSQVLFWLLAAIDGHAKNFSIFLEPNGKFRLTPLYDIMSAYPLIEKKQLQKQKIKMGMALKGKDSHYHWYNVQRRHFMGAAKDAGYSVERAEDILDGMLHEVEKVIERVSGLIPDAFPAHISEPIFNGMRSIKKRLMIQS